MNSLNQTGIHKEKIEYFAIQPENCKKTFSIDYINLLYKLTSDKKNYLFSEDVSIFETFFKNYFASKKLNIPFINLMKVFRGSKKLINKTDASNNDLWITESEEIRELIGDLFNSFDYSIINSNIPDEYFNKYRDLKDTIGSILDAKILNLNRKNQEKNF